MRMQLTKASNNSFTQVSGVRHATLVLALVGAMFGVASVAAARTNTLRIATYNIEDDTGTFTGTAGVPKPGLVTPYNDNPGDYSDAWQGGVLEGIGEEALGASNNVQKLDILALQQTTSNSITVDPIVGALNTYYGAGTYASSSAQATQFGSNTGGNGPSALVYNTKTLQLVNSVGVGTPQGATNGEYRQVMRYEFAQAGVTPSAANDFYVYVSNYKSGSTAADLTARNGEAQIIRSDSATLPADARIVYVGSYNNASSSEAAYQTITGAGTNQGVDPLNPTGAGGVDFTANSALSSKTYSTQSQHYRNDMQAMTGNVYNYSSSASGLQLIPNTYHVFGNDGSLPYLQPIYTSPSSVLSNLYRTDTLDYFVDRNSLLEDLFYASGHLPVIADYTLGPGTSTWSGMAFKPQWGAKNTQAGSGAIVSINWDSQPIDGDNLTFKGPFSGTITNDYLSKVGSITFPSNASSTPFHLGGNALTISGGITNNSNSQQFINLNLTLSAPQQFSLATNVTNGLVFTGTIDNGGNLLTLSALVKGMNLYGAISGTGGLVVQQLQQSAIPYLIAGNNTYSGGTTVIGPNAGFTNLTIGNDHALGTGGLTVSGAAIDLAGFNLSIGGLNGNGAIYNTSGIPATLTVGGSDQDGAFSGALGFSATLGLVKVGSGTQLLSGSNVFVGGVTVNGGTVQLGSNNALRSTTGGTTVNTGGTLDLHGFSPTVGALFGTGGSVQSNVAGAVSLTVGNNTESNSAASYAGTIANGSGTVGLIITGKGAQTLSGDNTYSGGTTVGATLNVGHVHALGIGGLTIRTGKTTLLASLSAPVQLPSLQIQGDASPTATLDITNNNLIVHNGDLATMTAQVVSGLNGGALWTGMGITSSAAAADGENPLHAVALILNSDVSLGGVGDPIYTTWPAGADSGGAVSVTNTDVLIKYTYFGDADLSGTVDNSSDYLLWVNGYSNHLTGWLNGDFDYSGTVDNSTDYLLWLNALANQGAPLMVGGARPVPEPGTFVLAAMGLAGVAAFARRHRK